MPFVFLVNLCSPPVGNTLPLWDSPRRRSGAVKFQLRSFAFGLLHSLLTPPPRLPFPSLLSVEEVSQSGQPAEQMAPTGSNQQSRGDGGRKGGVHVSPAKALPLPLVGPRLAAYTPHPLIIPLLPPSLLTIPFRPRDPLSALPQSTDWKLHCSPK